MNLKDEACPLRIGNQVVFDRCFGAPPIGSNAGKKTAVGEQICNILKNMIGVAHRLSVGAQSFQNNAQRDLDSFTKVTFNNAVDLKALEKFDVTNGMLRRIDADIEAYKNDKFCGSKAAMAGVKKSFETEIPNLRILGEGITSTAEAANAMLPVATETGNITTEIGTLRAMSYNRGGNAINSYNQLNSAAMTLQNVGNGLRIPDLTGIINAGSAAVMDNLPFITDCAVCAGALGLAAANIVSITAQPSVAMTTCLPTAGIGCIVAAAGVGFGAYSTIFAIALADPFCRNAASKVDDGDITTEKLRLYFENVAKIIDHVDKTDQSIVNVRQKLDQLYRELGSQAKPTVDKINTSLNRAQNALEKGKDILWTKVVPKINRYAGNRFQQMRNQAKQLHHCYENIDRLSGSLTQDVLEAATDMQQAKGKIFDAGILDNIVLQGQAAAKAGATLASKEWQACESQEATLHTDIWGVQRGKVDAGKTAGHLAYLAANPSKISTLGTRVAQLKSREANMPFKAVDEGKKAFLNLAQSKANSGKLFDEAEVLASNAAKSIAKSQAKQKAKDQAAKQKSTSSSSSKVKAAEAAPLPSLNVKALDPKPVQK
ncbi:MAG: hypothetical protein NT028_05140 [candidate division Zixibacteria bacterium]|nr:hypothetical protein [candidate division Zixibacteria bacterium]